ncbi:MAG: GDP-mannose 4,6-dehydratase [Oleispira sp.]|nr:GDP-mannose 4,6-dehydratase [Oleispira sp.]
MKILVTGFRGFTGRYVSPTLSNSGHEVIGLASNLNDYEALAAEIKELKPQAVIHLAAIAFVGHGNANDLYNVNLLGTRNLLEALSHVSSSVEHVLLASSANIYGNASEGELDELTPANPANDYAVSKYAMEMMANLWVERLPISIVRPFNYTGIGQDEKFLIPKIVSHFKQKKAVIELGNLDVWREFNDVRFVAKMYSHIISGPPSVSGQCVNICTGKAYSLREVITLCEKITDHKIDIQVNPEFIRANEVKVLKGSDAKLKQLVGTDGLYELEETLRWMLIN